MSGGSHPLQVLEYDTCGTCHTVTCTSACLDTHQVALPHLKDLTNRFIKHYKTYLLTIIIHFTVASACEVATLYIINTVEISKITHVL